MQLSAPSSALQEHINERAATLRHDYEQALWKQTDRLFALLLVLQWLAGVAMAAWLSPWAWRGLDREIHPHVWAAVFLGGLIAILPISLAIFRPGETFTRMVIAVAQMLHSALLIHLSGGRIETHFHVFGSLAFLSFYRDWRVLIPATVVVAVDHFLRGTFAPESVFGLIYASPWRWLEHAGWVVFEDIFLVWACIRGARELATLALRQAELESSHERIEAEVARQTARLEELSQELVSTARRAGMAEVATGVLHNVGNVLNTVNVAASVVGQKLRNSEVASLMKAGDLLKTNEGNLAAFLTTDERGKHLPRFLIEVADFLGREQAELVAEVQTLQRGVEHIKEIVGAQQQHAKNGTLREKFCPADLFAEALAMDLGPSSQQPIEIERHFEPIPATALDKHKLLQILINLLSNAKKSVLASGRADPRITLSVRKLCGPDGDRLQFEVGDNGVGIAAENLARIFSHGFTTRKDGHGFGLHSAANAAAEMHGSLTAASDGPGLGSRFTLEFPIIAQTDFERIVSQRKAAR
jgi:signal transduction histidine kinase